MDTSFERDPFYAIWTVVTSGLLTGTFDVSIVVQDDATDSTRINPRIHISGPIALRTRIKVSSGDRSGGEPA